MNMTKGRKTVIQRNMNKKSLVFALAALALLVAPTLAGAQQGTPQDPPVVVNDIGSVFTYIQTATTWLFGILLVLAVIFLLYSAFLYLTSGGEEEKVKKAKGFLIYSIIAIVIALLARGIIALVRSFFGV